MMYSNEEKAYSKLEILSNSNCHSIIIDGFDGVGKTYMAFEYARLCGIQDMYSIDCTMLEIKEALDICMNSTNRVLLCIENIDTGVDAILSTVLKYLEEPSKTLYIVITCRNISLIPDTVRSRCQIISLGLPSESDLTSYITNEYNQLVFSKITQSTLFQCCKSYSDIDIICKLSLTQRQYFSKIPEILSTGSSVSTMAWKMSHFEDKTSIPTRFLFQYLLSVYKYDITLTKYILNCLSDLYILKSTEQTVIKKFCFLVKYKSSCASQI